MATSYLTKSKPKPLPCPKWFKLFSFMVAVAIGVTALLLESPVANSNDYVQTYVTEHKLTASQREDLTAYLAYWYSVNQASYIGVQQVKEAVQQWRRSQ